MRHVILIRHSWLLENHAIALRPMMLWQLPPPLFTSFNDTSPRHILMRYPNGSIAIRIYRLCLWGFKPLDLGRNPFPIVLHLHWGRKVTQFFMIYWTIVLIFILQLILHGCGGYILSHNLNKVFVKLFVLDVPNIFLETYNLHWRWRQVLCQVLYLTDTHGVLEDANLEGFHNGIMNIFDMVLEDAPIFPLHALSQLEPNIFLEVEAPVRAQV